MKAEPNIEAPGLKLAAPAPANSSSPDASPVFRAVELGVRYGQRVAVRGVSLDIRANQITALIGPSGCGKSSLIRCFNRMNDLIPSASITGKVMFHDQDLYAGEVDPVEVRRKIGMVFQKPNPFPKSIFENVAFGLRINGLRDNLAGRVEHALKGAALWDEVCSDLRKSALSLSGGQQQRLCIARALAVEPEVLLMDEPASALDPIATAKIEDLMQELKSHYTIVIVTHNMQQAARASDMTAFFTVEVDESSGARTGVLVEFSPTSELFTRPSDPRTEAYITGRFG